MPNWCNNEVTITFDNKIELQEFIDKANIDETTRAYLEENEAFFDVFVPTPSELTQPGNEGWYEWRLGNWGTKWNPTIHEFEIRDDDSISISMDTAWAPPIEFFTTFSSMYPSATIVMKYLEEGMQFCGRATFYQGSVNDEYINQIPMEMYREAGAVIGENGEVDWDATFGQSEPVELWSIIDDDSKFNKYVGKE